MSKTLNARIIEILGSRRDVDEREGQKKKFTSPQSEF